MPMTWAEIVVGAVVALVIGWLLDRRLRRWRGDDGHDNDDPEEGLDL
jgi:hypothetical protein